MKKAVVSLAAVLMVLASLATPSTAGKLDGGLMDTQTYTGQHFTVSYSVGNGVVGGTIPARLSIRVNPSEDGRTRQYVGLSIEALNTSRSAFIAVPVNKPRVISKSFAVPDRLEPGTYTVSFSVQVADEFKSFDVPITISSK